jgi:Sulfotransferase domain
MLLLVLRRVRARVVLEMVRQRSRKAGVLRGSWTTRRMDRSAKLLTFLFFVSIGTLWRQHVSLHRKEVHPQQGGHSNHIGHPSLMTMPRRSRIVGTINMRNATMYLHQPLPRQGPRTTTFTCQILNRTVTIPTVPHFLIVGAQKAGTTALLEFLKQHPDLESSMEKETHFFDWHYPSQHKRKDWLTERRLPMNLSPEEETCAVRKAYSEYFNATSIRMGRNTIVFEKTPGYLFLNEVPKRIATTLFWKPKIVVILRNPVDRAISNYRMKIRTYGRSFEDIVDAELASLIALGLSRAPLRNESHILEKTKTNNNDTADLLFGLPDLEPAVSESLHWKHYRKIQHCNYIQRGMYAQQLERWLHYFPINKKDKHPSSSSLLVLQYEEFREHPERVFERLLAFVGAKPFIPADGFSTMHNYHPERNDQMLPETRHYLTRFFQPYNRLLVDLLGDEWRGVWEETGIPK